MSSLVGPDHTDQLAGVVIALLTGAAIFRFKISSFWLILSGAALGYLFYLLGLAT